MIDWVAGYANELLSEWIKEKRNELNNCNNCDNNGHFHTSGSFLVGKIGVL